MSAPLWQPSPARIAGANLTAFMARVERDWGVKLAGYDALYDWSVAELKNSGTLDYVNWEGVHRGYVTTAFEDGSTTTYRYEGPTKQRLEGRVGTGIYTYVGGTGKFAGIKGAGSYRGTHHGKMSLYSWHEWIALAD